MPVIYKITNKINNSVYVGYSGKTAEKRLAEHKSSSKRGDPGALYSAMRKYGIDNFMVETIEENDDKAFLLKEREPYWIRVIKESGSKLYNMTEGGEGGITSTSFKPGHSGAKISSEGLLKLSAAKIAYWKQWRIENPNYKDNWKTYEKIGWTDAERNNRSERISHINKKLKRCEHCSKESNLGNYNRWHGENCKNKI
jgi:group I intron endonuclease